LGEGKLAGAVNGDIQMQFALCSVTFGEINVETANGISLELLPGGFIAFDIRQPADAMSLQASVQRGPGQMRDRRLQRMTTLIQRQERMPPEGDNGRFLIIA
jgi:hypothetical protein